MKTFISLILFAFSASPLSATIAVVQSHYQASSSTNAFASNNTAGNMLIAIIARNSSGTAQVTSDSQSNPWVNNNYYGNGSGFISLCVQWSNTAKTGANTVTFTTSVDSVVIEISGADPFSPDDFMPSKPAISGSSPPNPKLSNSVTTLSAGETLIWAGDTEFGGGTLAEPSGFTFINGGINGQLTLRTSIQTGVSVGTYSVGGTYTGSNLRGAGSALLAIRPSFAAFTAPRVAWQNSNTVPMSGATATYSSTGGHLLVLITHRAGSAAATVSSDTHNTWTLVSSITNSVYSEGMYYAANSFNGSSTVTFNTSTNVGYTLLEYSGVVTSSPLDTNSTFNNAGTTVSVTTTNAHDLLVGFAQANSSCEANNVTSSSGWNTDLYWDGCSGFGYDGSWYDQFSVVPGTYSLAVTNGNQSSTLSNINMGVAAFKLANTGAGITRKAVLMFQ